jgi:hypothetical protein
LQNSLDHANEEKEVRTRTYREVFVRHLRGLGATRVHDDNPATPALNRPEIANDAWPALQKGHALGDERVRSEQEREVGSARVGL